MARLPVICIRQRTSRRTRRIGKRRRCFVGDGARLIMPAFGAYTGGLNVLNPAIASLFGDDFTAFVIGREAVYPVRPDRLCGG